MIREDPEDTLVLGCGLFIPLGAEGERNCEQDGESKEKPVIAKDSDPLSLLV
jgi:hypothetical protein